MQTAEKSAPTTGAPANPFHAPAKVGGLISVEQQRAVAEVQAAMLVARSMPRDRKQALDLILQDCTDIDLAEEAEFEFARGGSKISGPSIRLLEAVARRWGNLQTGIEELARHDGYSEFRAYAVDLESGWRDEKKFQVRHWRDTKQGGYQLTDERDIYELGANMGTRRKRACMEAVIPADIVREAAEQCATTLTTKIEVTTELIAGMLERFQKFNVTKEMIEKRIQRHVTAITPGIVVQLRRIYNSLKDGMAQPDDFFEVGATAAATGTTKTTGAAGLRAAVSAGAEKKVTEDKEPPAASGETAGAAEASSRTVIDYIAGLDEQSTADDVTAYMDGVVPEAVRGDERFTKAVQVRLAAIKAKAKK